MATDAPAAPRAWGRGLLLDLLISGVCPVLLYLLLNPRLGEVPALILSGLPPAGFAVLTFLRNRHIDAISGVVLLGIVLTLGATLLGGSARLILMRDSLVTGVLG